MKNPKILLVEDNPGDAKLVKEAFKIVTEEAQITLAENAKKAEEQLFEKELNPDLVILDIKLPGRDGHEILRSIRQKKKHEDLPVIMLTNSDAKDDITGAYDEQANSYITKPLGMDEFIETVKYIKEVWLDKKN
ncbi:MAG: response regulator [Candidatus Goldiibacteriota bacterium]